MDAEPVLPFDLEREIFERAALQYHKMIPTLLVLCRRIHRWLELFLYRVLDLSQPALVNYITRRLDSASQIEPNYATKSLILRFFSGVIRPANPPQSTEILESERLIFLRNTIRHIRFYLPGIWVTESEPKWQAISRILRFNPSIFELAIQMYSSTVQSRDQVLMELRPARLTLQFNRDYGDQVDATKPIFTNVTHLTLLNTGQSPEHPESWAHWTPGLPAMPALTHLCVSDNIAWGIIPAVLHACPRLEAVVAFWAAEGILRTVNRRQRGVDAFEERALALADNRLVLASAPFWEQWERGARVGQRDLWQRVNDFLERKRRGQIAGIRYILDI
ncbi:hypothetical protein K438DRAFT_1170936 [Mycena galopus ATCC 62051]|nr:hypothetical protein K438DRAFT_1170936 [Mycena galopus ATCC 62051]